jgi:hypothetical protein
VCVAALPFITQVLTILSTGLALGAAVANSRTPQDLAAVLSLLAVGVVATRIVIDLRSFVLALLRIMQRLRRGAASENVAPCLPSANNDAPATLPLAGDDLLAWDDFFDDLPEIRYNLDVTTVNDGDDCVVDDSSFWDADGNYLPQYADNDLITEDDASVGSLIGGVFVARAHHDYDDDDQNDVFVAAGSLHFFAATHTSRLGA